MPLLYPMIAYVPPPTFVTTIKDKVPKFGLSDLRTPIYVMLSKYTHLNANPSYIFSCIALPKLVCYMETQSSRIAQGNPGLRILYKGRILISLSARVRDLSWASN
jgi:hypothetical protein